MTDLSKIMRAASIYLGTDAFSVDPGPPIVIRDATGSAITVAKHNAILAAAELVTVVPAFPVLTPRQFWLAAAAIGLSEEDILVAVNDIDDAEARLALRIEITKTTGFERDHPSVNELADLMGMPAAQLDSLWLWASGL